MDEPLDTWFKREILAHEGALVRYLLRTWPKRQEVPWGGSRSTWWWRSSAAGFRRAYYAGSRKSGRRRSRRAWSGRYISAAGARAHRDRPIDSDAVDRPRCRPPRARPG